MCALVVGDIHGHYAKAKAFLDYKPEEEHIFTGDYTDSFKATNDDIVLTMKMIFDSDAIVLSGNHDNQYFAQAAMFTGCSGYRPHAAPLFTHLFEMHKDKILAAYIVDDYIITHAGISEGFGKMFDSMDFMVATINSEFEKYKNAIIPMTSYSPIFNIPSCRGGRDMFGGVFWADYRLEEFDLRFNQVYGHSPARGGNIQNFITDGKHITQVGIDCPEFYCYNTFTGRVEDFMPEELKASRDLLEVKF